MRQRILLITIAVALLHFLIACQQSGNANITAQLIDASKNGMSISEYPIPEQVITNAVASEVKQYIVNNPDATSYHMLFLLKYIDKDAYSGISSKTKSQILCSALANCKFLNDWGHIATNMTNEADSARELLSLGKDGLPFLQKLLDDKRPALHFGSADATLSRTSKYRRADFAYRYINILLGRESSFPMDLNERDRLIDILKNELPPT